MTPPQPPGAMTVGMRIDSAIASIESMPSTHLYGVILAVSVVFSFALLNSGGGSSSSSSGGRVPIVEKPTKNVERSGVIKKQPDGGTGTTGQSSSTPPAQQPEPKWIVLKCLNYAAVVGFLVSVVQFASDASTYLNDSSTVLKFLAGWSACLCYFFGFFGISFVDADELAAAAAAAAASEVVDDVNTPQGSAKVTAKKSMESPGRDATTPSIVTKPKLHPPATSTPVCGTSSKPTPVTTKLTPDTVSKLSNDQVCDLVLQNQIKDHQLEKLFGARRAVTIRRLIFTRKLDTLDKFDALSQLPHDPPPGNATQWYDRIHGANCEIVTGYIPIPVGIVGPLTLNGETVYVPMATTEGCLVASTNRGCKAISSGSMGAVSTLLRDGITRAPCLQFSSAQRAAQAKLWMERPENFAQLRQAFETTTSFGKLLTANPTVAGRNVYLRLQCFSGDAMGMNMVSKGSLAVVDLLKTVFDDMTLIALSGNMCTDKKAAAMNWIEGRGKSVVVETVIPQHVVRSTLKTTVSAMVTVNQNKNLIGSAMAGAIGGFNAHASNIVTAIFLATGQDPAQNVESSNCITLMEETSEGDLWMSCTMPSIEVGTVGGGTGLPAQSACLDVIGVRGGSKSKAGENAQKLAHVVAGATMAGELSLLAALAANTLVAAHMQHNRKPTVAAGGGK